MPSLLIKYPDWTQQQRTTEVGRLWQIEKFKQSVKITHTANETVVVANGKAYKFLPFAKVLETHPGKFVEYLDALENLQESLNE
jgi:hypothetical protein